MNVLFITLDQFRGDSYGAAGHPLVTTPTLDRLAGEGVRLARHYSQAAPCAPGRAALYTGTYQMNNRVVANGTPLRRGTPSLATVARRAGYDPTLFGYTDQGLDPHAAVGPEDPRLNDYDGVLPGLSVGLYLPESQAGWVQHLRSLGYDVPSGWAPALRGEPDRPAEHSLAAFLTDRFLEWLDHQESGWFAHLSYLRPHPPYAAAGRFSSLYDPADVPDAIEPAERGRHPIHDVALTLPGAAAPTTPDGVRALRAQYYGMVSEVDSQLARVVAAVEERGEWADTLVVVTADHGDQLGDHGLIEKLGYFPQSYHILGLWRDPRTPELAGTVTERFTENVDLLPSLAVALGGPPPPECDGRPLQDLWADPDGPWRAVAHYEWDYRRYAIGTSGWTPTDRSTARQNLAVSVGEDLAYVQFGDGSWLCFDLAADPTWRTLTTEADRVLPLAQEMLVWRQEHLDRELTEMLLGPDRRGRWPDLGW